MLMENPSNKCCYVSTSLSRKLHFAEERFARGWTATEPANPVLRYGDGLWLGVCEAWWYWEFVGKVRQVIHLSNDIDSTV